MGKGGKMDCPSHRLILLCHALSMPKKGAGRASPPNKIGLKKSSLLAKVAGVGGVFSV